MPNTNHQSLFGKGIYSVSEAARLTRVPPRTIRRWVQGYTYRVRAGVRRAPEVLTADLPELDSSVALSFRDLIEVRFVDAFRKHGVGWKVLRAANRRGQEIFETTHPFSLKRFRTDGKSVFADIESSQNQLLDVLKSQFAFEEILAPYLYRGVDIESDEAVRWWHQHRRVVLDPKRSFGQPVVHREGVPTAILAKAVAIEDSIERVAKWYQVAESSVLAAVEFENRLAA